MIKEKSNSDTLTKEQIDPKQKKYPQIKLLEDSIDIFQLPFPEKNMLIPLQNYYKPYSVSSKIGQQDGPDFKYIDIVRPDAPVVYFNFVSENELVLNRIFVYDSTVIDQYGLSVGCSIEEIKKSRGNGRIGFDPYHQHVYYSFLNSNIHYEIIGNLKIPADVKRMEDLKITEKDIQGWTIQYIIWRKK